MELDRLGPDLFAGLDEIPDGCEFIRENDKEIYHICDRWENDGVFYYSVCKIWWDILLGEYTCRDCICTFDPDNILKTGGTGYEGRA